MSHNNLKKHHQSNHRPTSPQAHVVQFWAPLPEVRRNPELVSFLSSGKTSERVCSSSRDSPAPLQHSHLAELTSFLRGLFSFLGYWSATAHSTGGTEKCNIILNGRHRRSTWTNVTTHLSLCCSLVIANKQRPIVRYGRVWFCNWNPVINGTICII